MRLIDGNALWEQFRDQQCEITKYSRYHQLNDEDKAAYERLEGVLEQIDDAPTIEAEPVKHGRWISHEGYDECSKCRAKSIYGHNYCSNCGAKMDGGAE